MMNVNCLGPIAIIKQIVASYMEKFKAKQQKELQIVNILSIAALFGVPCRTMYSASKFGLDGFGKSI